MGQITLDHVAKEFGNGGVRAVDDVDLTIGDGEFMVLVGPSGCFFEVDAEPFVVEDAMSDEGDDDGTLLVEDRDRALFAARVDARTKARVGEMLRLSVDPSRLYFFSPESGESLLGRGNGTAH